jgi:hypothetical protein
VVGSSNQFLVFLHICCLSSSQYSAGKENIRELQRNMLNMQGKRSGKTMKTKWKEMEDEWNAIDIDIKLRIYFIYLFIGGASLGYSL